MLGVSLFFIAFHALKYTSPLSRASNKFLNNLEFVAENEGYLGLVVVFCGSKFLELFGKFTYRLSCCVEAIDNRRDVL